MTLVALRTPTAPAPRAARIASLVVPGALLCLCTAAAASIASAHVEIAHATQVLLALH